jgi:Bacterial Ig-like domain
MSNEQLCGFSTNNLLYPNQIIPESLGTSWPEPFGVILQASEAKQLPSGQLPLLIPQLFPGNLGSEVSRNTNIFANNLVIEPWQFNSLSVDNSLTAIDTVRQKITASFQPANWLDAPAIHSALAETIDLAQQQIASFFQQPDLAQQLSLAFGQGVDLEKAKSYSQWLPSIEVVPDSILGKANGAYAASNNSIFLAHSLVERGDRQEIVAVLVEEIGHSIDAHLNATDSSGDEGEIFAKLVSHHLEQDNYLVLLAEDDHNQIIWQGQPLAVENATPDNFTIRAAGTVEIKGNSDLDGNPLILQDDALIYAGKGFSINGNAILPVKRDFSGNPLRDSKGKLILVDRAVAVSAGYSLSKTNSRDYGNLIPPQIVAKQEIDIPSYSSLEQQYLTNKITNSIPQVTFNATSNISTVSKWQQNFPAGGSAAQLRVIKVTGGGLNIPTGISLSNSIIIVENGDINLQNGNQQFNNVTLVTKNGDILLGNVQAKNLTVLSSRDVSTQDNAKFDGNTLLANKHGNIVFRGATSNLNTSQNLQVISHGEIRYHSSQATRGQFLSTWDFVARGSTNLFGTISSQHNVFLNGNTTITAIPTVDVTPPTITVTLTNDSGSNGTDRITKDAGIKGQVTDPSGIAEFKVQVDGRAGQIDLKSKLQVDGSFNLTDTQVRQLVGNLADGAHSLAFSTKDPAGNQSTFSLSFTLDTTAPLFTLNPLNIIKNDGKLVGQITDSSLDQFSYQWDSGTAKAIALTSGSFNQTLDFTGIANGLHRLTINALDKAGNITVTPYNVTVTRDLVAPIINAQLAIDSGINNDNITNNPTITGTVLDESTVASFQASFDGINFVNVLPQRSVNGSITLSAAQLATIKGTALTDGVYNLSLKAQDQYGNASTVYSISFTLDTTVAAPGQLALAVASDSGSSNVDRITNIKAPQITGTGEAGSTISLLDGIQRVGQTTVGIDGNWQITSVALVDGQHQLTAQQTDKAGNTSIVSSALALTIDSIAPTLTLGQSLDNATLASNARLQGSIADGLVVTASYSFAGGQTVVLPINNGQFDAPFDFTGIADGSHQLTLNFTDAAGNSLSRTSAINLSRGPLLTVALLNDTGASNSDGITTDVTIRGQVADRNQISRLEIALDGSTNYADFTFALQNDNSFQLSALQVKSLAGGQLSLGAHTLNVRTVTTNGVTVGSSQLSFTLQATDAANVQLALATNNDSGPIGDGVTDAAKVSLIAKATPGSTLTLAGLNRTGVADATGQVVFDNIDLLLGANNFTAAVHLPTSSTA